MKLFAGLKRIREFERRQLPFLKSVIDFDIIIEIGYAEEQGQPLTLKQLFLLEFGSRTTVRRKLAKLVEQRIDHPTQTCERSSRQPPDRFSFRCQAAEQVWWPTGIYFRVAL